MTSKHHDLSACDNIRPNPSNPRGLDVQGSEEHDPGAPISVRANRDIRPVCANGDIRTLDGSCRFQLGSQPMAVAAVFAVAFGISTIILHVEDSAYPPRVDDIAISA
jgi:hypothetical protein